MIVWLASYPRSGNTFFRLLLHHLYGVKTYSVYDDPLLDELGAADAVGHDRLPAPLPELDADPTVHFVKTHDLPTDDKPAVYLVRDGRDAVVSYARFVRSFIHPRQPVPQRLRRAVRQRVLGEDPFVRALEEVITEPAPYGGWGGNVFGWLRRPAGRLTVLRFEDLVTNPVGVLGKVVGELQLGVRPTSAHAPSFEELHAKWPSFFRKGKVGSWREEMPERLQRLFWEKHGEAMRELGYQP